MELQWFPGCLRIRSLNSDADAQGGGRRQKRLSECGALGSHVGMVSREVDFVWNIVFDVAEEAAQCILEVWILK